MGAKKQADNLRKNVYKVLAIVAGVLFVVLMVVSSMGSGWITSFTSVKPGDVVVLDYTLRDAGGNPFVTTDQTLYRQMAASGYDVLYARQMTVTANKSLVKPIYPVQVYTSQAGWANQYGMFASEYDAMESGILGLKVNEQKRINVNSGIPLNQFWGADQLKQRGLNLTDVDIGYVIPLGVSENPVAGENTTPVSYVRFGEITNKTAGGVMIDFSHPIVDVRVVSINNKQ